MESLSPLHFTRGLFGDLRLSRRAIAIGTALSQRFGKALSEVFQNASDLKRAYEFFANTHVTFERVVHPHQWRTATAVRSHAVVLAAGDTTYLDYGAIKVKRSGYGPTGTGGNGLLLHSSLLIEPQQGEPLGLAWQKLWKREPLLEPPADETPEQKRSRQAQRRKRSRQQPFEDKESYRWVEALQVVEQKLPESTRIIHIFDWEGDITEVFEQVRQLTHTGVVVRATHDRSLDATSEHLWQTLEAQPIQFEQEINLPETGGRAARRAKVGGRFCAVNLRKPSRFDSREPLHVYAVYAQEIDCPPEAEPISWMLLTTEGGPDVNMAATILRWYTFRWRIEEYHKVLKSGCQVERYRLAGESMQALLAFLCVIAVELLRLTYLHRTQPDAPINQVLRPVQVEVLQAKMASRKSQSPSDTKPLSVDWGIRAIARLGGYLEHRRQTAIGIQVLWRGWLTLETLCEGWELAHPQP